MTQALATGATLTLLLSGLLAGCSSDDGGAADDAAADKRSAARKAAGDRWARSTTPARMLRTGIRELERADSVRVRLDTDADGETPRIRFDLTVVDDDSCFGSLRFGGSPKIDVTVVEGTDYLRTSADGWREFAQLSDPSVTDEEGETVGRLYAGKWVSTGEGSEFCAILDELERDLGSVEPGRKAGFTEAGGVRGVKVSVDADGDAGTAVVGVQAPHPLLSLSSPGGSARFSEYGKATEAPLPPESQRIDVSTFE